MAATLVNEYRAGRAKWTGDSRGLSAGGTASAFPGARVVRRQVEQIRPAPTSMPPAAPRSSSVSSSRRPSPARGEELTQAARSPPASSAAETTFDAVVDPIVRNPAGRLRRSLERYYLLSGKHDPVQIALPRGTYVPTFTSREEGEPARPEPLPETSAPPSSRRVARGRR